jgi:hypothetical protein
MSPSLQRKSPTFRAQVYFRNQLFSWNVLGMKNEPIGYHYRISNIQNIRDIKWQALDYRMKHGAVEP